MKKDDTRDPRDVYSVRFRSESAPVSLRAVSDAAEEVREAGLVAVNAAHVLAMRARQREDAQTAHTEAMEDLKRARERVEDAYRAFAKIAGVP